MFYASDKSFLTKAILDKHETFLTNQIKSHLSAIWISIEPFVSQSCVLEKIQISVYELISAMSC